MLVITFDTRFRQKREKSIVNGIVCCAECQVDIMVYTLMLMLVFKRYLNLMITFVL